MTTAVSVDTFVPMDVAVQLVLTLLLSSDIIILCYATVNVFIDWSKNTLWVLFHTFSTTPTSTSTIDPAAGASLVTLWDVLVLLCIYEACCE